MEKQTLICVVCPVGCTLDIWMESDKINAVSGNSCSRGYEYACSEILHPRRVLTSTVKVSGGKLRAVPVKTSAPVARELLFGCMREIRGGHAEAPVRIGQVIIGNILGTGIDVIATGNVARGE